MKIKPAYTRTRVTTKIDDRKTKAIQSEKKHSDINNIVAKAMKTGQLPVLMNREPLPEFPDVQSYQDAMNKVVFANQQFERLPAKIREKFHNSPVLMLSALEDSKTDSAVRQKLEEFGLLDKQPSPPAEQSGEAAPSGATSAAKGDPEGGTDKQARAPVAPPA
jgi:phage internal scaffolding protein